MAPYAISYLGPDGDVVDRHVEWFQHDDHAIDTLGDSDYPHVIVVHQADRLVATFPPLHPNRRELGLP